VGLEAIGEFPKLLGASEAPKLAGIYTLTEDKLTYCMASTGSPRPTEFAAPKTSKRTLISLERFPPGEHKVELALKRAGARIIKNEAGWIVRLQLKKCDDNLAAEIGRLNKLDSLLINSRYTLTEQSWRSLANLESLRRLNVVGTSVTDAGLEQIAKLKQLKKLSISGHDLTDKGLLHLSNLENLTTLFARRPAARKTGNQEPAIALASSLRTNSVAANGLLHLRKLNNLKELFVSKGQFTTEVLSQLQSETASAELTIHEQ